MGSANNTGEQLPGFRHHEPEAVEIVERFKQFRALESCNGLRQLAALAQGMDQILPGLAASLSRAIRPDLCHSIALFR